MSFFIGFDTSNYTTSAAAYNSCSGGVYSSKKLLDVKKGEVGLRQSEALFSHVKRLPEITAQLVEMYGGGVVSAVCASTRPRAEEGSYMPCFLAGEMAARVCAEISGVPFFSCSHQQGHLAAAVWSSGRPELIEEKLLAFHLSGGTTELLYVEPGEDGLPNCRRIGGSTDISAGQVIDRCGVMLGFKFPAGARLDKFACRASHVKGFLSKQRGLEFSLSGVEKKCREMYDEGEPLWDVARFAVESIILAVFSCVEAAQKICGDLPLLLMGGVASNSILQREAAQRFGAVTAPAEYSSDNAVGAALLAARLSGERWMAHSE